MAPLLRKGHFLRAKLRSIRGSETGRLWRTCPRAASNATPLHAPSVSYLSMIESGKRAPFDRYARAAGPGVSTRPENGSSMRAPTSSRPRPSTPPGGAREGSARARVSLLQGRVASSDPGTASPDRHQRPTVRAPSHPLAPGDVAQRLPRPRARGRQCRRPQISAGRSTICSAFAGSTGPQIRWFERKPVLARDKDREVRSMVRSFFESPRVIYANRALQSDPARLKFDLAAHTRTRYCMAVTGRSRAHATGGEMGGSPRRRLRHRRA